MLIIIVSRTADPHGKMVDDAQFEESSLREGPLVDGKPFGGGGRKWEAKWQGREDQGTLEGSARDGVAPESCSFCLQGFNDRRRQDS